MHGQNAVRTSSMESMVTGLIAKLWKFHPPASPPSTWRTGLILAENLTWSSLSKLQSTFIQLRRRYFVDSLTSHARLDIFFSAAPPGQGGENHVNEKVLWLLEGDVRKAWFRGSGLYPALCDWGQTSILSGTGTIHFSMSGGNIWDGFRQRWPRWRSRRAEHCRTSRRSLSGSGSRS